MMTVDLTQAEYVVVKQIVENKMTALLHELAHTDDRSYRDYVRETIKTVELLQAKLDALPTQGVQPGA